MIKKKEKVEIEYFTLLFKRPIITTDINIILQK